MGILESVVLGVVQGLTEFLPISSTAHLRLVPALLHWEDPGAAYSAAIQLGSIVAVIAYFFKDIITLAGGSLNALKRRDFANQDLRISTAIAVGTIPICVIGLALKGLLETDSSPLRALPVIGGAAIVMGLLLLIAEKAARHNRTMDSISIKDGLIIGLGQAMALIPGCSRSGSTLTVAMLLSLKRDDAARFSFLLGIPAITLSGIVELVEILRRGVDGASLSALFAGTIVSCLVSYISIAWLLKFLRTNSTWVFIIYRFIFGIVTIGLSAASIIH